MRLSKSSCAAILATVTSLVGCLPIALTPTTSSAQFLEDTGDFAIEYVPTEDETYAEISEIIEESQFYDELVSWLNETFVLPTDIFISFEECGTANAFYDPSEAAIIMCYELIEQYSQILGEGESAEFYDEEVIHAGYFTFLHELGHALIDLYQLPIVGREEDAVDALAAVLLVEWGEEDAVIAGADQFSVDAEEEAELEELPYWGEHGLSIQRYYNMACLIYGSDPEGYADWVSEGWLPEERAERCDVEYEQAASSWEALLEPYLKETLF